MKYLIKELMEEGILKTPSIIDAFEKVDRKDFVPEELKDRAYLNTPLPIGYGQTISQPLRKKEIKFWKSAPVRAGRRRCWPI